MATGAAATAAQADTTAVSTNNSGILNGTQVFAPIQAPINLCGVAVGVLGNAAAACEGGSAASLEGVYDASLYSFNNHGILNGTQVFAPIQAPINLCGVAVSVLGAASAWCQGGAKATQPGSGRQHHDRDRHDYDRESTESATEALPVMGGLPAIGGAPIVGGLLENLLNSTKGVSGVHGVSSDAVDLDALDAVGTMSAESLTESDEGGYPLPAKLTTPTTTPSGGSGGGRDDKCDDDQGRHRPAHRADDRDVTLVSHHNSGILNGTQIYAPIQVPINISGVAVGVLGDATAWSLGGATAR
jgi:hypothetical protein